MEISWHIKIDDWVNWCVYEYESSQQNNFHANSEIDPNYSNISSFCFFISEFNSNQLYRDAICELTIHTAHNPIKEEKKNGAQHPSIRIKYRHNLALICCCCCCLVRCYHLCVFINVP